MKIYTKMQRVTGINSRATFRKLFYWTFGLFLLLPVTMQAQQITLNVNNQSIRTILKSIEQQSDKTFVYNAAQVDVEQTKSMKVADVELSKVLNILFEGSSIQFVTKEDKIILTPKAEKTPSANTKFELQTITGKVTDDLGDAIPGATVIVKGTGNGTISDLDGNYTFSDLPADATLVYSFIGMISQELSIAGKTTLNVKLESNTIGLEEYVAVGYGTMKKANLTGAVSQITSSSLKNKVAPTTGEFLQGASPNLTVTMGSGDINASPDISIRGTGSVNGGSPLVLIDGIEGDLERINPRDIESISVLKDAASASIYGARGAFGVVLITTKSADNETMSISYSGNRGWSSPTIQTDNFITDGLEWAQLSDKLSLLENTSTYLGYTDEDYAYMEARKADPSLPSVLIKNVNGAERYVHYGNTDWWNTMFQDIQPSQEHNLSVSGGSKKVKAILSGRFYTREGIYKVNPDVLKKYSLRSRIEAKPYEWLTVRNTTNIYSKSYTHPATNTRNVSGTDNSEDWRKYTYHASPVYMPTNPDGSYIIKGAYTNNRDIADGTFADLLNGKSKGEEGDFETTNTTNLVIDVTPKLKIKGDYSFRNRNQSEWVRIISTPYTNQPNGEGVAYYKENTQIYKELERKELYQAFNAYADYNMSFGDSHNFTALAGFNREVKTFKRNVASRDGNLSENLNSFNLSTGDNIYLSSTETEWAIQALFYRLKYDYKSKYLLEFNGRLDASSKFPTSKRSGFFPSASAAWRVSEESFWEPIEAIVNNFKLRGSFGQLGNQNVGEYDYISTMNINQGNYIVDGKKAEYFSSPQPVSSNYTWEYSETLDLGFDIQLLKSRLNINFDWFQRDTKDMLTQGKQLPSVFGATEPDENAADLRTKGYEILLGWNDSFDLGSREFRYHISGSLGDARTYITKFDNPNGDINQYYVGQELGEIWGYTVEGFFQTDDEYLGHADQLLVNERIRNNYLINHPIAGDIKFKNLDGDASITPGDQTLDNPGDLKIIGNSTPRYNYSFTIGADYAGFDFSAFFQGVGQLDWNPGTDNGYFWGPYTRQYLNFYPQSIESMSWTPDNTDAYFPRLAPYAERGGPYEGAQLGVNSDKYLQNAAYLRLKNLTVGYTLPKSVAERVKLNNVRVYATGTNLLTFSPLYAHNPDKTVDPEQLGNGNAYPFSKTFTIGLDVKF